MKKLTFLLLILATLIGKAQSPVHGLIAYTYQETTTGGNFKSTNKKIYIIYDDRYCELFINGRSYDFAVTSYTSKVENGFLKESFLNEETDAMQRGWYDIEVTHNHKGGADIIIQMPMWPGGKAFSITNARDYNKDGKVNGMTRTSANKGYRKASSGTNIENYVTDHMVWTEGQKSRKDVIGQCDLSFDINDDGIVKDVTIDHSILTNLDEPEFMFSRKLVDCLKSMPKWEPAIDHDKKQGSIVRVSIKLISQHQL